MESDMSDMQLSISIVARNALWDKYNKICLQSVGGKLSIASDYVRQLLY